MSPRGSGVMSGKKGIQTGLRIASNVFCFVELSQTQRDLASLHRSLRLGSWNSYVPGEPCCHPLRWRHEQSDVRRSCHIGPQSLKSGRSLFLNPWKTLSCHHVTLTLLTLRSTCFESMQISQHTSTAVLVAFFITRITIEI